MPSKASRPPSTPPLDVLFVRPALGQGGADRVTCTLLASLDRSRFRPRLALFRHQGDLLDQLPADVPTIDLGDRSLWFAWLPLARLITASKPDVLFSTSGGANLAASLAHLVSRSSARLVLSERNMLLRPPYGLRRLLLLFAKAILYRRADLVTAVSNSVAQDLHRKLRLASSSLSVVHNPIVGGTSGEQTEPPCPHPWLNDSIPVILGAGRLVPAKDFTNLIKAFAIARNQHPCRLIILGDGPENEKLHHLSKSLAVDADVAMPGFRKDVQAFMRLCTTFVLSSRAEGLPGVLIQAMSNGAPVIATDCPGAAEAMGGAGNGVLVPVGNAAAMAEAIVGLLEDPTRRGDLSRNGRQSSDRFRIEKIMPLYETALLGGGLLDE